MKKSLLYLFMFVCSVSLFSSCGDDDDEVKYPIDTDLAGGYIGKLSVVVDGNQMGTTENQKISIAQSNKGANQIALSLKNFTFLINVGDIEVDPCTVKLLMVVTHLKDNRILIWWHLSVIVLLVF